MSNVNWRKAGENFTLNTGPIERIWTDAFETVFDQGATHMKVVAKGRWRLTSSGLPNCGPDGLPERSLPAQQLLVSDSPPGALIGKFGGSSASLNDPKPFGIGRLTILSIPDKMIGPLFLGFNGAAPTVAIDESLVVELWTATI